MSISQANKKYLEEIQKSFQSGNEAEILVKVKEFKNSGSVGFLELLLNLLKETQHNAVRKAILAILSNLQRQEFTPSIVEFVKNMDEPHYAAEFIAACWESRLDLAKDLIPFADKFITGSFQTALESFTVIEEAMWQTTEEDINTCRTFLIDRIDQLSPEKKELFNELIHVLESGKTQTEEDYPELYPKN